MSKWTESTYHPAPNPRQLQALAIRDRRQHERGGKGATYRQIGEELGVGAERARQMLCAGEIRLRRQLAIREASGHDEHVRLYRRLMTGALQALRNAVFHKKAKARNHDHWHSISAGKRLLERLVPEGPHCTWPAFQRQGPVLPFIKTKAWLDRRDSAIEWFMRGGLSRAEAEQHFENNERGLV